MKKSICITLLGGPLTCLRLLFIFVALGISGVSYAQHEHHDAGRMPHSTVTAQAQPLLSQAKRLEQALRFLGSSLMAKDALALKKLEDQKPDSSTIRKIQEILDPYCIALVNINPEARVKVAKGAARPVLMQDGWTSFLVKVQNEAGVTGPLNVESENAAPLLHGSSSAARPQEANLLTPGQVANRFLEAAIYRNRPMQANLSGLPLEYAIVQLYSKEAGQREAEIGFNIGHGSQDIGFRNSIHILFAIDPAVKVIFQVKDDDGKPVMASFVIRDDVERLLPDTLMESVQVDYRTEKARNEFGTLSKKLKGIYPLPSRRVAAADDYPDFYFQPQVYRATGESVRLPPGNYEVNYTRGPEYLMQTRQLKVPQGKDSMQVSFQLKRWINMADLGWYSADHHVHAAGCSHYESPEDGVLPIDMFRQAEGEDLNMSAVLTWGPGWYRQKEFFTGTTSLLSTKDNVMRYDVEVSGFPSSHAGHIVLLNLTEDDYPGTKLIEEWPSWTLPVLQWAKKQNALTGYAHSGWGLEPLSPTVKLPNYVIPRMDGIGANEYIVSVTQQVVDVFSAGDTPAPWELNMWYHTLNCGFRTRISGETDFPCIFDERVGMARSYYKPSGKLDFPGYIDALKKGKSYVSEGRSHIIDFSVNGVEMGTSESEVTLAKPGEVKIKARASGYLPAHQDEEGAFIAAKPLTQPPYWHLERSRIIKSRSVAVELIVNGMPVDTIQMPADGSWKNLSFAYALKQSSWVALRIYPSSHTNPVFITVEGKPIVIKESAEWCRKVVDQCWKMKEVNIRPAEKPAAEESYNKARKIYDDMISQAGK